MDRYSFSPGGRVVGFSSFVALLLILVSRALSGQTAVGEASASLERVVELARERAPAILAARAGTRRAEALGLSSTVLPDPELTVALDRGKPPGGDTSQGEWGVEVTQFLPSPRAVRARAQAADSAMAAADTQAQMVTADVVLEVRKLYYEAAVAQAQALSLAESAQDARSLRKIMEKRVELGESSEGDRLRTKVEALRADLEARAAASEADADRAALNRFLLGALGPTYVLATPLDPAKLPEPSLDMADLVASRSPAYRAAGLRVDSARWAVSAERAARLPGLAFSFFTESEIDRKATGFKLGISVPLWNRNEGAVRLAQAEQSVLEFEALGLRASIQAEAERLARSARTSRELAVSYSREILPAAGEALSILRFSLEQGEANLLSWLEARRSYLEILRASYRAELDAFTRAAELERLLGGIDVSY